MTEDPPVSADPEEARSGWFERHLGDEWELVAPGIYRRRDDDVVPPPPPPVEERRLDESLLDALPGERRPESDEELDRPRSRFAAWRRRH